MNFSVSLNCRETLHREYFPAPQTYLRDDEKLNNEAIKDWFLGARKQLGNIELFL